MGDGEQENGIWQENRKRDAARGDGEQENGIGQENRNRDAAQGDGEQENGIWLENGKRDAARGTGNRRTGSGRRTSDHTRCKLAWPNSVTPPVLLKNPVLLFFPPPPPPPGRGLTPHRSLKWPAREGGFRLSASRRPLRGRLRPSSRAGLAFGAHQAKPSAEARFAGLTENCHTANQSQESTCLTMLRNKCCVGYWKAGGLFGF